MRTSGRSDNATMLAISAPAAISNSPASRKPAVVSLTDGESDAGSKKLSTRPRKGNTRFARGTVDAIANSPAFRKAAALSRAEGDSDAGSRRLTSKSLSSRKNGSFNLGTVEAITNSPAFQNATGLAGADGDSDCESRHLSVRGHQRRGNSFVLRAVDVPKSSTPAAASTVVVKTVVVSGSDRERKRSTSANSDMDGMHSPASSTLQHLECCDIGSPGKFRPMRASSDVSSIRSPGCDEPRWDSASFCASDFTGSEC